MKFKLLPAILLASSMVFSQNSNFWSKRSGFTTIASKSAQAKNLPSKEIYELDLEALKSALSVAPERGVARKSNVIISFPNAEGVLENFRVFEASVLHPDLAAKYPGIKSYAGVSVDNPADRIRFSLSPKGLHSMRLGLDKSTVFIEPYSNDLKTYSIYNRADKPKRIGGMNCTTDPSSKKVEHKHTAAHRNADDGILRTYRIAVSTTGEYGSYHGGTVAQTLAAINTTMTRVNGLYESDFNVTMVVVANTDRVIYTNANSDPYTGSLNSQLQTTLTNRIGEANYDIGHLFHRASNNGNAGCIGCVCVNGRKGSGFSATSIPEGEVFDVDYVAHEIGHQFGGNHTWTHGGNEGTNVQMEPGSGSTIMGYAGITGSTDVQQNSDPYFHAATIEQITDYIKTTSCQTNTNTGNNVPVANAGSNYTIPRGTPFVLTGSATDADSGDVLSYCWEQIDENNASTTNPSVNATSGVAFRSYPPSANTSRYFPRLETVKTGATSWRWEAVPNVSRNLNFRLTVRDNRAGGGTNDSDDMRVTVNASAGPFVVTSPNTGVSLASGSVETVTWNVAGTTGNGVNAATVDILLSTDGGDTYTTVLASGVTNDGSHNITVPNAVGTQNRIMVKGSNHIFFDISNSNFTITGPVSCTATVPTGVTTSAVSTNGATVSWNTVGGATYDVRYRQVGTSSWTTNNVTSASIALTGLSASTQYEVQVRSKCNSTNTNSAYSSSVTFTTASAPSCQALPYSESFEANDGWTQAAGDDGNWVRDANGTPSNGTGPSSATDGNFYMFLEASTNGSTGQIGSNATAILESPCFDLTAVTSATFSFSNHMFGTSVGSLALQASTNGTNWINVWTDSGSKGNQWNNVSVNLNTYVGGNVSLRFVGTTGTSWSSDIAIDNLSLTAGTGNPDPGCDTLNFNDYTISSFSNQDSAGNFSIGSGGATLTLTNNTWKFIDFNYTVTPNTVIEFEFSSTSEGEIHGVGFENDNNLTSSRYFKVYGTQNYGVTNFDNYTSGTQTYVIPVGDSYTGTMDRLVFINDNDGGSGNNSTFSNVKIYETSCSSSSRTVIAFGTRQDVLGDEDENILSALTLAPNPVLRGTALRILSSKAIENTRFAIVNSLGQTLKEGAIKNGLINTRTLSPGVYIIKLKNDIESSSQRFIVK
ncbi:reprolysin-like metallopeptidase [Tenacibaculum agarivorans]|uniref:reprolysin-like metallopeptidase n=1 Tax=Tenacibaculum agarivorans TaxID=1908389 RepID=UPI00094B79C7|nr:zinc-dependent metalloprotease family protein [Tenacibaculum agarivorans]